VIELTASNPRQRARVHGTIEALGRRVSYLARHHDRSNKMCEEYNGWTNRETWAANLWIDNERGLYEAVQEEAERIAKTGISFAYVELAHYLEETIEELLDMEEVLSAPPAQRKELISMSKDIGSLYRVNWSEIAKNIMNEIEVSA